MPRHCSACQSPYIGVINDALAAGKPIVEVAKFAGISADAVGRHRKHTQTRQTYVSAVTSPDASPASRAEQVQIWLKRAEELYFRAGSAHDLRGQVAALREGLRALELDLKRAGELASAAHVLQSQVNITNQTLTIADFDRIIADAEHTLVQSAPLELPAESESQPELKEPPETEDQLADTHH